MRFVVLKLFDRYDHIQLAVDHIVSIKDNGADLSSDYPEEYPYSIVTMVNGESHLIEGLYEDIVEDISKADNY